jgi:two-component system, cell cycle sensor histidine kinase and response regulator CckA
MMTPDSITISRMKDGLIIDANTGFEEITGWKRCETIGRTSSEIKFYADPSERDLLVEDLKNGRNVLYREFQFRCKDGSFRAGIYSARSIQLGDEKCYIFVMQDITDRRLLEEERRKMEEYLYHAEKMDAIGKLSGGLAHDFNNILMGIQANASLMLSEYNSEDPHCQRLRRIQEHIERGANLTKQLLGFAREAKSDVKGLSVNKVIRKSAEFFIETRKGIDADFHLQDDIYPVEADIGQIEQVLFNIYINAGHAMPNGGHLHIQTINVTFKEEDAKAFDIKPGDYVKISISDTGIGMDAVTLKRIFEPFFTTKSQHGGTGLGLASAYGIIRNHGGAINAHSAPGHGSTFNIYLPSSVKKT